MSLTLTPATKTPVMAPVPLNGPTPGLAVVTPPPGATPLPGPSMPHSVGMMMPMQYSQPLPGSMQVGQGLYSPPVVIPSPGTSQAQADGALGLLVVSIVLSLFMGFWMGWKFRG